MTYRNKAFVFCVLSFSIASNTSAASDILNPSPLLKKTFLGSDDLRPALQLAQAATATAMPDAVPPRGEQARTDTIFLAQKQATKIDQAAIGASDSNDEVLSLLRQSESGFTGSIISLPSVQVDTVDKQVDFLTLDQVLNLALDNSFSYAATSAQAKQADYAAKASFGQAFGPTLDARAQKGREYTSPASIRDSLGNIIQADVHKRWDVTLIGRQPLFAPASFFDFQKQRSLSKAADLRSDDARESLYYAGIKAYYDVLRAYSTLSFARSYASRMEQLLDYMRKRMEGGGASKIDFERVRGRMLQAQAVVAESEGTLESTMVTLTQLIGTRVNRLQVPERMMPALPASSQMALRDIYDSNPGIRAARSDTDAAKEELRAARARFSPNFAVEWSQSKSRGAGGDQTLATDRRVMLVMTMNLLNGGSDMFYQSQIGAKLVEKTNVAADLERKLKEQVEINYRTLGAVKKRMFISRDAYQTNANVADVFLEQLSAGSKQLIDVLDAYQQAYQTRTDFALLLFQQADISYQILRNIGRAWTPQDQRPEN